MTLDITWQDSSLFIVVALGTVFAARVAWRAINTWREVRELEPGSLRHVVARAAARRSIIRLTILIVDTSLGVMSLFTPPPLLKAVSLFNTAVTIGLIIAALLLIIDAYLDNRYQLRVIRYRPL